MELSWSSVVVSAIIGIVVGLVLLLVEYRTGWFAGWRQQRLSDSHPDAEELLNQRVYIQRCVDLIDKAEHQVVISTSKMSRSEDLPEARQVNRAIRNAQGINVGVRLLVSASYDRLPGAIELVDTCGADVRFDPEIPMSDINYYCADRSHVILAIREPSYESQHQRSISWVEFRSAFLASVLTGEFEGRWAAINTRRLEEYMHEILPRVIQSYGINTVARQLEKPPEIIEQYLYTEPFVLFVVGRPGSGKTTIVRQLEEHLPSSGIYRRISHLSDLEYLKQVFQSGEGIGTRYEQTQDGGFFICDTTLYDEALVQLSKRVLRTKTANDLLIVEFARQSYRHALDVLSNNGVKPNLIVYLDVEFETALERNKARACRSSGDNHYVSEREMRETFASDDIGEMLDLEWPKVVIIDNNRDSFTAAREEVLIIIEQVKEATT